MANTKAIVLQETANNLNTLLKAKAKALPKGFNETRFLQNCMTVLQDTRNIEKCNSVSVARTMLKGAFLGLDFLVKNVMPYHTMIIKLENVIWNFKLIIKVKEN